MNKTRTNAGSWDGCARRTWCNDVFRAAIPETLRTCFKQFQCKTAETYNGDTVKISNDYFALFAEKEIKGSRVNSNTNEASALSQIAYYSTADHQKKKLNGSGYWWWERSPASASNFGFCYILKNGGADRTDADGGCGIAPFGCI